MNRIDFTQLGGFPLVQEDLGFLQSAYTEALGGILSAFSDETFILSGGVRTEQGGTVSITAGYLSHQGEVLPLSAASFPATGVAEVLVIESLPDPAGLKQFKNGTFHQTYQVRRARVLPQAAQPGDILFGDLPSIYDIIEDGLPVIEQHWTILNALFQSVQSTAQQNGQAITALQGSLTTLEQVQQQHYNELSQPATETQRGRIEIATQQETDDGTDDTRAVTPLKLKNTLPEQLILARGNFPIGNVPTDQKFTVPIPNVGTSNYIVLTSVVVPSINWDQSNDVFVSIGAKTPSSFELCTREVAGNDQDISVDYVVVRM